VSAPTRHIAHAVALLPALVLLLTAGAVHAQGFGKKGTLEIGGEGSYSSRTLEVGTAPLSQSIDQSETRITPIVGWFLADNLEIGALVSYISSKSDDAELSAITYGAHLHYFFGERLRPYGRVVVAGTRIEDRDHNTISGGLLQLGLGLLVPVGESRGAAIRIGADGDFVLKGELKAANGDTHDVKATGLRLSTGLTFWF